MMIPTSDEMKILADQFVAASVKYVTEPSAENMQAARLARQTLHAGIALLVAAANKGGAA